MSVIRRKVANVLVVVGLAGALLAAIPSPGAAFPLADLGPELTAALQSAGPDDELVVVAVVEGPVDPTSGLEAVGLDAVGYENLPMVALRGTSAEVLAGAAVAGVSSMWLNLELDVVLAESTEMIGADHVHDHPDLGYTGAGVGIAILDSGIDGTHPDLEYPTKTIQNVKVLGNQHVFEEGTFTVEDVANTDTSAGHGTHVAGIAAGTGAASDGLYEGVAPGADLIGIGSGEGVEMVTAIAGYDWILGNHETYGIRVINNSWADGEIEHDPDHPLNQASRAAHDAGIVVVFAAGNDGQASGDVYNRYAFGDHVIGVGGVTKLGTLGDYSSRGDESEHVDVMAPGSFIASTRASTGATTNANSSPFDFTDPLNPRVIAPEHTAHYTAAIGTSMAAPHVTGVVALMLEANPDLTPDEVRQIIIETAAPVPGCPAIDCGAGIVNAVTAVQAAIAALNQPPVAVLVPSTTSGQAPLTVSFDASASFDPDGSIVSHDWDLDGDGVFEVVGGGELQVATYPSGSTQVAVRVTDDRGAPSAPAAVTIRSSDAPVASATAPSKVRSGDVVTFDASASYDPDGAIAEYRFNFGDGTEVTTIDPVVNHVYSTTRNVRLVWTVTVVDGAGVADAVYSTIRVKKPHPGGP